MTEKVFMNKLTNSKRDFLQEFIGLLKGYNIPFTIIGGLAVNVYAEPVVSLDVDVVISLKEIDKILELLNKSYKISKEAHSINISAKYSDIRIQIQIDERYQEFIPRSSEQSVLGYKLPVAHIEDVLQGKVWALQDNTRRQSKRQKDLADIMRLVETHPHLKKKLPEEIKEKINE